MGVLRTAVNTSMYASDAPFMARTIPTGPISLHPRQECLVVIAWFTEWLLKVGRFASAVTVSQSGLLSFVRLARKIR